MISALRGNRGLYHKTYYGRHLRISIISLSVCPWQAFPARSSVFLGKARAYPSEASLRYSTLGEAPSLTQKHQTRLEILATDIHSSLLRKSINYSRNKFMIQVPDVFVICEKPIILYVIIN